MNRANNIFEYGIKDIPDMFICNEKGEILYYSIALKKISFIPKSDKLWKCKILIAVGNLEDWYNVPYDGSINSFYFRTFKRNKDTGKDEPLCFAITPKKIIPQKFSFKPGLEPFEFPIIFNFHPMDLLWVRSEDCPKYSISFEQCSSTPYKEEKIITFTQPIKNYKQVKIEQVKKRLEELKNASKRNNR